MKEDYVNTVRERLRKVGKGGNLRGSDLVKRLHKETGLNIFEIRMALKALREVGEIKADAWTNDEPLSMVKLNLAPIPKSKTETLWLGVLSGVEQIPNAEKDALSGLYTAIEGMSEEDMGHLLDGLINLKKRQQEYFGQPMFNVSAEFLMGSSKLLGKLDSQALKAFGIERDRFLLHPSYVVIAGPEKPKAVILVENPHAFELAISCGAARDAAWIVTFGYGLSKTKEDYGKQLSDIVTLSTTREIKILVRQGNPPPLEDLLAYMNLFFWGDLDREGLRIFERIKKRLPQIMFSALYHPMIAAATDFKTSHPYVEAVGKDGQELLKSDDPVLTQLVKACENRAVDQEIVKWEEIIKLHLKELTRL